jgi:elongation factor P
MEVVVCACGDTIIEIRLPETVVLQVKETESVVKGQTAASSFKPAILENGIRIMVPPFVSSDDKVIVKTEDSSYVERYAAKK